MLSIQESFLYTHRIINIQYLIFMKIYALTVIEHSLMKQEVSYTRGGRSVRIRVCIGGGRLFVIVSNGQGFSYTQKPVKRVTDRRKHRE